MTERGQSTKSWSRMDCTNLYDPFEPTRLKNALSCPDNLGYLIFGPEWRTLAPIAPTQSYDQFVATNPLAKLFDHMGTLTFPLCITLHRIKAVGLWFRSSQCSYSSQAGVLPREHFPVKQGNERCMALCTCIQHKCHHLDGCSGVSGQLCCTIG